MTARPPGHPGESCTFLVQPRDESGEPQDREHCTTCGATMEDIRAANLARIVEASAAGVIAAKDAEIEELRRQNDEYENCITWFTSCRSCAVIMDSCAQEMFARIHAEDRLGVAMRALRDHLPPDGMAAVRAEMGKLESPGLPDPLPAGAVLVLGADLAAVFSETTFRGAPAAAVRRLVDAARGTVTA